MVTSDKMNYRKAFDDLEYLKSIQIIKCFATHGRS
jgi:hypothetical protein